MAAPTSQQDMFPWPDDAAIGRMRYAGRERSFDAAEILIEQSEAAIRFFVCSRARSKIVDVTPGDGSHLGTAACLVGTAWSMRLDPHEFHRRHAHVHEALRGR